jgi:hypothetical protein
MIPPCAATVAATCAPTSCWLARSRARYTSSRFCTWRSEMATGEPSSSSRQISARVRCAVNRRWPIRTTTSRPYPEPFTWRASAWAERYTVRP